MSTYHLTLVFLLFINFSCNSSKKAITLSPDLSITQLSSSVYVHVSSLATKTWGKVPCNGMIYTDGKQAYVFDTPADETQSKDLIRWLQETLQVEIAGVIVNHFHVDCLGGLQVFHDLGIPSYSSKRTQMLAEQDSTVVPQNGFEDSITLKLGDKAIVCEWLGEAHTKDNIIAWLPEEKTMFGGCMVKRVGAGKGNLADANVEEWSNTVKRIKAKYGDAKTVIPGHGAFGGVELLDYTIGLFEDNSN